jgi:hypothetical protein
MAGDRMVLAMKAGTAAAVSETRTVPRASMLGPFLTCFDIVVLRSSGALKVSADARAV